MNDSDDRHPSRPRPDPGDYSVVVGLQPHCLEDHEPHARIITRIDAEIICEADPGSGVRTESISAGYALAYRIDGEECADRGLSLWEVCDAFDQETTDYCEALFGRKGGWIPEVETMCRDVWSTNLLILSAVHVEPAHRGKRLGLRVARVLIDLFPVPGGLVACQPRPMRKPERAKLGESSRDDEGTTVAIRALTRYWGRMGFKPLGDTGYCVLDPGMRAPSLNEL